MKTGNRTWAWKVVGVALAAVFLGSGARAEEDEETPGKSKGRGEAGGKGALSETVTEETIPEWVKTLSRMRTVMESAPARKRPASPAQMKRALKAIDEMAKLDREKVAKPVAEALDEARSEEGTGRYFLMRALGKVGGETAIKALKEVSSDWSGEIAGASPQEFEAMVAAALLYRAGEKAPFEKVLKAIDQGFKDEEYLGTAEEDHFYNRACLLAVAGRKEEALQDLRKADGMPAQGNTSAAKYASQDPDLYDLWEEPAFKELLDTWE